MMTPEQRLDRVENILRGFIKAGRRSREEWNYKLHSLIDAQIRNEAAWRAESHALDEKIDTLIDAQLKTSEHIEKVSVTVAATSEQVEKVSGIVAATSEQVEKMSGQIEETSRQINGLAIGHSRSEKDMAELREAQKLTDKALRAFIDSLRKGGNGNSS